MKRTIVASTNSTRLKVIYLHDAHRQPIPDLRTATVTRSTFIDALRVLLEDVLVDTHVDTDYIFDDPSLTEADQIDAAIQALDYMNGEDPESDCILYLANESTGDVYIDYTYPEENY